MITSSPHGRVRRSTSKWGSPRSKRIIGCPRSRASWLLSLQRQRSWFLSLQRQRELVEHAARLAGLHHEPRGGVLRPQPLLEQRLLFLLDIDDLGRRAALDDE